MSSSYFFSSINKNENNAILIDSLQDFSSTSSKQVFVIDSPLGDERYSYELQNAAVVLIPGYKISFVNINSDNDLFDEFVDDFIEDIGSISDKFDYKTVLGRPKKWSGELIHKANVSEFLNLNGLLDEISISDATAIKKVDLLISLLTGSINDIDRVKSDIPENVLDKIKQKIILFDGDQTRFIYEKSEKKVIKIQGLSGTGKTELLLHKIKDLYLQSDESKILFTCHNKILADELRNRIPRFFDFMKVQKQISWNSRLYCMHAWGSSSEQGAYRYLCGFYGLSFKSWSRGVSFDEICKEAVLELTVKKSSLGENFPFAFDWAFIDESQDFGDGFLNLCEIVTKNKLYVAGDIFQSIFDNSMSDDISPDYLLSKCYRTDPRTLMFAHGLGMGLFETKKMRWLEDSQWQTCGYLFDKVGRTYNFRREPLKRFEDLQQTDYKCVRVTVGNPGVETNVDRDIVKTIEEIQAEHPTVTPSDICIILLDGTQSSYNMADRLARLIPSEIGWDVNKAYETKKRFQDTLLISNRNNVKGLEFAFVICVTNSITKSYSYRNALYTMLTRSFIQSRLLITSEISDEFKTQLTNALNQIYQTGKMIVEEPTEADKQEIMLNIQKLESSISLYDLFYSVCDSEEIPQSFRKRLFDAFTSICEEAMSQEELKEWIVTNYDIMSRKRK